MTIVMKTFGPFGQTSGSLIKIMAFYIPSPEIPPLEHNSTYAFGLLCFLLGFAYQIDERRETSRGAIVFFMHGRR